MDRQTADPVGGSRGKAGLGWGEMAGGGRTKLQDSGSREGPSSNSESRERQRAGGLRLHGGEGAADEADGLGEPEGGIDVGALVFECDGAAILHLEERGQDGAGIDVAAADLGGHVLQRAGDRERVLDVQIVEARGALADGIGGIDLRAHRMADVDTKADAGIEGFDELERFVRRRVKVVLGTVIVDGDADLVFLGETLDEREGVGRGSAGHHLEVGGPDVFEGAAGGGFVVGEIDDAGGDGLDAGGAEGLGGLTAGVGRALFEKGVCSENGYAGDFELFEDGGGVGGGEVLQGDGGDAELEVGEAAFGRGGGGVGGGVGAAEAGKGAEEGDGDRGEGGAFDGGATGEKAVVEHDRTEDAELRGRQRAGRVWAEDGARWERFLRRGGGGQEG